MPIYAWVILGYMALRCYKTTQDSEVSMLKALIVPGVFTILGLLSIFTEFKYLNVALASYVVFAVLGTFIGYQLYSRTAHFFYKDGKLMKQGSFVPMFVMIINGVVKFAEKIMIGFHPVLLGQMHFNIFYGIVAGVTVGLFFGGLINTYLSTKITGKFA
jgi:hypothetical protein